MSSFQEMIKTPSFPPAFRPFMHSDEGPAGLDVFIAGGIDGANESLHIKLGRFFASPYLLILHEYDEDLDAQALVEVIAAPTLPGAEILRDCTWTLFVRDGLEASQQAVLEEGLREHMRKLVREEFEDPCDSEIVQVDADGNTTRLMQRPTLSASASRKRRPGSADSPILLSPDPKRMEEGEEAPPTPSPSAPWQITNCLGRPFDDKKAVFTSVRFKTSLGKEAILGRLRRLSTEAEAIQKIEAYYSEPFTVEWARGQEANGNRPIYRIGTTKTRAETLGLMVCIRPINIFADMVTQCLHVTLSK